MRLKRKKWKCIYHLSIIGRSHSYIRWTKLREISFSLRYFSVSSLSVDCLGKFYVYSALRLDPLAPSSFHSSPHILFIHFYFVGRYTKSTLRRVALPTPDRRWSPVARAAENQRRSRCSLLPEATGTIIKKDSEGWHAPRKWEATAKTDRPDQLPFAFAPSVPSHFYFLSPYSFTCFFFRDASDAQGLDLYPISRDRLL